MAQQTTTSPLLAGLDEAIAAVEAEARALQQQVARQGTSESVRGGPRPAPAPGAWPVDKSAVTDSHGRTLEDLAVFLSRLNQMKEWLQHDDRLLPVLDQHIGQRVRAMEKRTNALNMRLAVITTVAGAVLGWLTSLAQSPASLLHAVFH
jgi:hypothetical protein